MTANEAIFLDEVGLQANTARQGQKVDWLSGLDLILRRMSSSGAPHKPSANEHRTNWE